MLEKMTLSANQMIVLEKLGSAFGHKKPLVIRDFADVATVETGREEWAKDPLKALEAKGLVEFDGTVKGRAKFWSITLSGCEQLLLHRSRG